jgi:pyroglutamyl-peptidase
VLTGFRAFPGVAANPTEALVAHLAGREPGLLPASTRFAMLDVDYRTIGSALDLLLDEDPAVLVLTGYSHRATGITLEARATTLCAVDAPDAAGFVARQVYGPPIDTAIDLGALQSIITPHAPCSISDDAGQYLCNYAYRHALDRVVTRGLSTRALFVHLPAIAGTPLAASAAAALPLDVMADAVARIVWALAGYSPPE